jgi:hypothetical protein
MVAQPWRAANGGGSGSLTRRLSAQAQCFRLPKMWTINQVAA